MTMTHIFKARHPLNFSLLFFEVCFDMTSGDYSRRIDQDVLEIFLSLFGNEASDDAHSFCMRFQGSAKEFGYTQQPVCDVT